MIREISWQNAERAVIADYIESAKSEIERYTNMLEESRIAHTNNDAAHIYAEIAEKFSLESEEFALLTAQAQTIIREELRTFVNALYRRKHLTIRDIDSISSAINETRLRLASYQETIARYPDTVFRATLADIKKAVKTLGSCMKVQSTVLKADPSNPSIRVVFSGLQFEVLEFGQIPTYITLYGDNSTISVPLPLVRATIYPQNGKLELTMHKPRSSASYIWDGRYRVHPHVLSGNQPCLGDFNAPYREALKDMDWVLVFSLIKLFLTRAIDTDTAGRQWRNYFFFNRDAFLDDFEYIRFNHLNSNVWFKIVEQERRGTYVYEAYSRANDDFTRAPEHDFPHPHNDFVTAV